MSVCLSVCLVSLLHTAVRSPHSVPVATHVHVATKEKGNGISSQLLESGEREETVCLSVDAYSGTTGYEAAYELYKRVQIYKGLRRFS